MPRVSLLEILLIAIIDRFLFVIMYIIHLNNYKEELFLIESLKIIFNYPDEFANLVVYECGTEICRPGNHIGPVIRKQCLLHYVHSGKGMYTVNGKTYTVEAGQCFLILSDILMEYIADIDNPWHYSWVAFKGEQVISCLNNSGLNLFAPVQSIPHPELMNCYIDAMLKGDSLSNGRDAYLMGYFWLMLSLHLEVPNNLSTPFTVNSKNPYVEQAIQIIRNNYAKKININIISKELGIDSKYFWKIFKNTTGISPQQFLIETRMYAALELLYSPTLSISDVARSVGYDDALLFSKIFKIHCHQSPTQYRKLICLDHNSKTQQKTK